jgi:hypothetical protein
VRAKARWAITAAIALAIVSPLARASTWDSFPISSYPMFSRGDLGTRLAIGHVLLFDRGGKSRAAPPALVGTPEPMVAKTVIDRAIVDKRAGELCARVAANAPPDVVRIEIVASIYDTQRYFSDPTPLSREVHASCAASR